VSFKRPEVVLPDYKYLRNENDVVILLSHCGLEDDMELAQAFPWLDAIIGGHTHTLIEKPSETNGVLVTQSGSHLKYATLVKLKVKGHQVVEKEAVVLNVNSVRKEKPEIKQLVSEYNNAPHLSKVLAMAKTKFETPEELGCMMTDAICEISGADFAFQNTGGVRVDHLKKGPITVKDVYSIDPFNNEVVVYQMTGAQIKGFILNSYRKNGGFPSFVSGMSYTVSDDGRSVWVNMERENFSTGKVYKVALSSYLASTVTFESEDDGMSTFKTTEEMMIDFLLKHKEVDYQGVTRTK
jgi:2',3'-cyclic-nucleotide 2'-phosphodiesterase (5'-nucleotidase family)